MKKLFLIVFVLIAAIIAFIVYGLCNGWFWFVEPSLKDYPVRGVDVSHHQGDIDWEKIAKQNIRFAYLKATEGGDHKDTKFQVSWQNAKAAGMRVGAYHFFTPNTDGLLQAQNFIDSVPREQNMLPPVIDVEPKVLGDAQAEAAIRARLKIVLETVEKHYGVKPLIYTDPYAYPVYVQPEFNDYPLWYRSITEKPNLPDGKQWVIWQYNPQGILEGYEGREKFIDLNVFNGSIEEFEHYEQ